MKRPFILVLVLVALTALAIPAAAQSSPRVAPANDDFYSAQGFNPDGQWVVADVQDATTQATEPEHTCAASGGPTDYSVWFYANLDTGTLTISTAGSGFDTVVSLYDQLSFTGDISDDLRTLACSENGSGHGVITDFMIPYNGRYYVRVSASTGVTPPTPSSVQLTATFTSANPPANDEPDGAKNLKFPSLPAINDLHRATVSFNEPIDPGTPPGSITNSVWYTFTFDSPRFFNLIDFYGSPSTIWFSLFTKSGDVYTAVSSDVSASVGYLEAALPAGTYYLRVALLNQPGGPFSPFATILNVLFLVPPNFSFQTSSGAASLDGWTVKNDSSADGVACDAPFDCYFRFVSEGATEATKLLSSLNLNSSKVKGGDIATLQLYIRDSIGDPNLKVSLKLIDAAGVKQKYNLDATNAALDNPAVIEIAPGKITPVKSKLVIKNKDTDSGHEVQVATAIAAVLRTGEARSSTGALSKLPLFGSVPSAWQTQSSSPKSVLPVPPAP